MGRLGLSLVLLGALAACFVDTSQTYDLAEARAAFEAVPTLSESEYAAAIAAQEVRAGQTSAPPRAGGVSPRQGQPTQEVRLPPRDIPIPLGEGAVRARLAPGAGCAGLPDVAGREVLIVAAFLDGVPEPDVIFAARQYQAELAACVEQAGGRSRFQTRVGVETLGRASEVWIYTS